MADDNKARGLASADEATRKRISKLGGNVRASDPDIRSGEVGSKGGNATKQKYGQTDQNQDGKSDYYQKLGSLGGNARATDEDVRSGELGKKGAAARWGKDE